MTEYANQVLAALRNAAQFADVATPNSITRLGGLTNLVHRVDMTGCSVIVRIAGGGTEQYIDRAVEAHNADAAARTGVSPEVLFADPETGLMISTAVPNIETMTAENFASRAGSAARAGAALAKLHHSGEVFKFHFEPFLMIEGYLKILSTKDVQLPDGYDIVVAAAAPIKEVLAKADVALAPCHCDPLCEIGDLSVEAAMNAAQEAELLTAYFGREATAAEMGRIVIHKAMCDLLWTLWGLIQHADENPVEDFWAYATGRFERCKALMQDASFQRHVDAVRLG
jgi:thiamine kinase-like enzyme